MYINCILSPQDLSKYHFTQNLIYIKLTRYRFFIWGLDFMILMLANSLLGLGSLLQLLTSAAAAVIVHKAGSKIPT